MGLVRACCCCIFAIVAIVLVPVALLMVQPVNDALTVYTQQNLSPGPLMATFQTFQTFAGLGSCFSLPLSKPMLIACSRGAIPMGLYVPAHGWGGDGVGLKAGEPGGKGMFVFAHKAVTSYMNQPDLMRNSDIFIASSVSEIWEAKGLVPKGFFPLVIQMNTDDPERIKRRNFMNEFFPALMHPPEMDVVGAATHAGLTQRPWVLTDASAAERLVSALLFQALFGYLPPNDILDAVHKWADYGKACAVGKCQPGTDGPTVWGTFTKILASIEETQVGKAFLEAASQYGFAEPEARLKEILFITNFAGVGGTSDNVGAALYAVHKDPTMRQLFWENPESFVIEAARLYPGVAGMLTINNKHRTLTLGNGRVVEAPAGQEFYTWNSAGNIDPTVFGGPQQSQEYARQFHPDRQNLTKMLTWNAELDRILACESTAGCPGAGAARPCPGTRLALKISIEVMKYVLTVTDPISKGGEL